MDPYALGYNATSFDMPLNQKVFLASFDAIKKVADEGPCIIVGRCADYALKDYDNKLNVFVQLIKLMKDVLKVYAPGTRIITETNVPHKDNNSYFGENGDEADLVYLFPLPPLTMYTFLSEKTDVVLVRNIRLRNNSCSRSVYF